MPDSQQAGAYSLLSKTPWMLPVIYILGGGAVGSGVSITFGGDSSSATVDQIDCANPDDLEEALSRAELAEQGHKQMVTSLLSLTSVLHECQSADGGD